MPKARIIMSNKRDFFLECYKLGIIKFGKFTLKSGIESPFYVDLRPLASDPKILKNLAKYLLDITPLEHIDLICGVPYAALPMATAMSLDSQIPLIIKRKEAKTYGTKKLIEGIFHKGQNCLLVEDVITSGKSLVETITEVEKEDLQISDIVVVLDRQQGGKELLENKGFRVHTLFNITEVCEILRDENILNDEEIQRITDFLAGNEVHFEEKKRLSYEQKLADAKHSVGPHIVALKTHMDIISDFDFEKTILPLKEIAKKHNFLIMEDRKFADIGSTQEMQYSHGIYKISSWADLITSQVIGGSQSLDFFLNSGVIAILSMSSKGTLTDNHYFEEALQIAKSHPNVIGGVSQKPISDDLLLFTPGVNLADSGDNKGQQYNTPEFVFNKLHTDFIIVGRGIYKSDTPEQSALEYKTKGWEAYLNTL